MYYKVQHRKPSLLGFLENKNFKSFEKFPKKYKKWSPFLANYGMCNIGQATMYCNTSAKLFLVECFRGGSLQFPSVTV